MSRGRIYLAPPNIGNDEVQKVNSVIESGWVAPVGPDIEEFEKDLAQYFNRDVLALNSGTSALHLSLILAGVSDGDTVLVGTHTFGACANVILYERAIPIFLDSELETWNLEPSLLEEFLSNAEKTPKALIVTHIYGIPAKIDEICLIAKKYGVKVIEDAAEALGSTFDGKPLGTFGDFGVVSFNGNKIVTTSAGGALICSNDDKERAKYLATQANSGQHGYDHKEAGYNYRMSNVLAAIGIEQFSRLSEFVGNKRRIYENYKAALNKYLDFHDTQSNSYSNCWLSVGLIKSEEVSPIQLVKHLDNQNIETRRFWKPLHLHEAYSQSLYVGSEVSETLFNKGICLPSGTGLDDDQQKFVIDQVGTFFD